jgi:hypothetical protein
MKKVLLQVGNGNEVYSLDGVYLGVINEPIKGFIEFQEPNDSETTIQLVKQGISVDEIVKLKNNELI